MPRAQLRDLVALLLTHETLDGSAVYGLLGIPAPGGDVDGRLVAPHRAESRPGPTAHPAGERADALPVADGAPLPDGSARTRR